ncbi:unnamed protein product [Fusarium venenatum]|uniref:Zn(2)-C6 fungal-type domain-containing protein n=1 Tax=Fusarium venenatum TaxID=56646 RepID=A0A2L2TKQ6_9HYPO|nr:uncharacterized protein FVRRES_10825 [Fusarium venenatum]CEI70748.1 unnamed protein product [Fusarium venenatum]
MGSTHQAEPETFQCPLGDIDFKPAACLQCSQRKTKCDRVNPCTACIRSNLSCSIPGPRAPRKARRRNHHDIHDRLIRLENLLLGLQKNPTQNKDETNVDRVKCMMYEGRTPEFGTSKLWHIALENVQYSSIRIRSIPKTSDMLNIPNPNQIRLLGEIYLQRVQPVMSLLHIPSFTDLVTWAASCLIDMPPMTRALMWSCFSMAIATLDKGDCEDLLNLDKNEATQLFCNRCKMSLLEADYLVKFDLDTMSSQTLHNESEDWIFNGVLMRMAYKLGLHRDGTEFNLSPFETEMRRRAWWQLTLLEIGRSALSGLVEPDLPPDRTTRLPHNVNDRKLFPGMTEEVVSIDGPADTTYSVMTYEANKILLDCCGLSHIEDVFVNQSDSHRKGRNLPISAAACELFITKLNMRLGLLERLYCDVSAGPIYEAAMRIRTGITKIFSSLTHTINITSEPRKNFYENHIDLAEYVQDSIEAMHPWFRWTVWLNFRLREVYYSIGVLEQDSNDEILQRTWYLLARYYEYHESLWNLEDEAVRTVAYIVLRAWEKRTLQLISGLGQREPIAPAFVQNLQQMLLGAELGNLMLEDVLK